MHVRFEYDVDDLADASARAVYRSPTGRRRYQSVRARSAALHGLLAGALILAILPGGFRGRLRPAYAAAFLVGVAQWLGFPGAHRRAIRRNCLSMLGSTGPFTCEVELRPEGVWARADHAQFLYEWPGVTSIESTRDSIDFRASVGRYLVVRDRAFASPEERDKFLETARRLHDMYAGGASPP